MDQHHEHHEHHLRRLLPKPAAPPLQPQSIQQAHQQQQRRQQLQEDHRYQSPRNTASSSLARQEWQEELEAIFEGMIREEKTLSNTMLRFAKRPDITRQLLLLLAAFDPADRFFFSHQQYVRLASLVGVYNNYDRGHRLAQGAFLDHFEIDCWVVVTDGHPQQHTTHNCEHFNQYKAHGHAYVALWRVAAQPDLVRVLERKIAKHNLQAVEPLRFPDTPEFDDVPDCIYNLSLGLLEEAKTHIGLPGAENPSGTAPPGTLWKAHGEGAVVDHQLVDLDGHDPERGYEEYSDNVHVDFVLPVRAEDRNEARRKSFVVG